jgi:O-antigen/teichoic acid export membrane protein
MRESLQEGSREALALWLDTTRKLALVFLPLVGGLLVTADDLIVSLFTYRYAGSVPIFMVWSLTILFSVLLTDSALRVYAATRYLILVNLAKLALVAGLLAILLPLLGMQGAVLAAFLSVVLSKCLALDRVRRLMQVGVSGVLPWRSLAGVAVLVAASALPALFVRSLIATPGPGRLLVTAVVYGGVCALLLLRFGPLHAAERSEILRWVQRPVVQARNAWKQLLAARASRLYG